MSQRATNEGSPPDQLRHAPDDCAPDEHGPSEGQLSCSMASVLVRRLRTTGGEEAVHQVLRMAKVPYTAAYLEDVSHWIWYDEAIALFEAAVEMTGDNDLARRVGEDTVRQHAGTTVATLLRSLGSPEAIYKQLSIGVTKFSTVTEMKPVEVTSGRAVIQATAREGYRRHRLLCDWTRGLLSQPTALFGLPPASVRETSCEVRGDDCCSYTVTWEAEAALRMADPQELISALEAQLAAMADRLENMYATARDLIAFEDVDAALARITARSTSITAASPTRIPTSPPRPCSPGRSTIKTTPAWSPRSPPPVATTGG
jgi:predicted hydrocarbon binding protein